MAVCMRVGRFTATWRAASAREGPRLGELAVEARTWRCPPGSAAGRCRQPREQPRPGRLCVTTTMSAMVM